MTTYYPTIDEFWPAARAKNFVKALGGKPTKYVENMAFLAARAGVHSAQMNMVNPLTFADRNWLGAHSLLDKNTRFHLDCIRQSTYHPSTKWAYAMNEPIPPYVNPAVDKWAVEKATLRAFLKEFAEGTNANRVATRVETFGKLFTYVMTIESFLRTNPKFCDVITKKIAELKVDGRVCSIMPIILNVEKFLIDISPSWTEAEALAKPQGEPLAKAVTAKAFPLPSSKPSSLERSDDHDYMVVELEKNLNNAIELYDEAYKARSAEWNGPNHTAVCWRAEEMDHTLRLTTMDGMDVGVLIQAAHLGHTKVVDMVGDVLVRDHVGVDFCYENNFTALMYAAQAGHIDVVKSLLARGADPARKNCNGETATHRAIVSGFPEVAVLLLDAILATK